MAKRSIKKEDQVVVIAGPDKGKRGRVIAVLREKERIIVEGVKMTKRHTKKQRNPNAPQGGIIEREGSIHISNVMLAERFDARQARKPGAAAPAGPAA